jgi:hypothetical protein
MMKWSGGNIHDFHKAVKRLFNLTEVSTFVRPDCHMGLHIVKVYVVHGHQQEISDEAIHLTSTDELRPGCVLEVCCFISRYLSIVRTFTLGSLIKINFADSQQIVALHCTLQLNHSGGGG